MESAHSSAVHFAEAMLDMDRRRANELIQTGRALRDLDTLDEAYRDGAVSWSKVKALLPVIQRDNQGIWTDFARDNTFRALRQCVAACRPGDLPGDAGAFDLIHRSFLFQARHGDRHHKKLELARRKLSGDAADPISDDDLFRALLDALVPDEDLDSDPASQPLPPEERTDTDIPAEIRRDILHRDDHCCRNCHTRVSVRIHHLVPREHGGDHSPRNLVTLCIACHSLIHRGLLRIDHDRLGDFTFQAESGARTDRRDPTPAPMPTPAHCGKPGVRTPAALTP